MQYHLIYEYSEPFYPWWLVPLVFAIIAIAFLIYTRLGRTKYVYRDVRSIFIVCLLLTACSTFAGLQGWLSEHSDIYNRLTTGRFSTVEGVITDFRPSSIFAHGPERFMVNGVLFEYSPNDLSNPGFKTLSGTDGPLRNGVMVRIGYYVDSSLDRAVIIRLEVSN